MAQSLTPETESAAEDTGASTFSFVEMEHKVLKFWEAEDVFQQSLRNTQDKKPYIFYDGPPFATGLPHHGHFVGSILKDVVPRYWTMRGRYVIRRFGWDCHGLPIEHEIDKQLGMSAQDAVEKLGVAGYNNECRAIVDRYTSQWREIITRLGRWVDFDDDYKTMDVSFMESVWWVVKQLWDKGLIYQGSKVMPISTALGTVLANFEANSNYQDVQDPAITVACRLVDEDARMLAWTTTPWTLPSNLALCVGPDIEYVRARDREDGGVVYLARELLGAYGGDERFEILASMPGRDLVGRRYEPLFDFFAAEADRGAFVVISGDYVTTDAGTGIVHQAPAFGEDDYQAFKAAGIEAFACPVGLDGKFDASVPPYAGQHVKDADRQIIADLKASGALYKQDVIQHSYPFCWRSDTPLIYRAIPSWYVRVTEIGERLTEHNQSIRWVPEHIRDGRFGNWLEGAIDWAISRNRFWGTPLPIWVNETSGGRICIGSVDELETYTGVRVDDLHREFVDDLTFTVDGEDGEYRRIPEVLDCWFESGSMPYAQLHYPFENQNVFDAGYPAEFIAEGLDQTRGWFYTLHVLASALFDKPAFRNVIVNGMVLAEDGKKMSKSLRNYTPPEELMEVYGADALRLTLISSGLVRAEEQRFSDDNVREMARRVLLPWYNVFSFLKTYAEIDDWSPEKGVHRGNNVLDLWIVSRLQTLKARVNEEMVAYRLYNVQPALIEFIEELTNWYLRLNRARFWGDDVSADKIAAYSTLHGTLHELALIMAPFTPFLAEHLYFELASFGGGTPKPESVHLCSYPQAEESDRDEALEEAVARMRDVILLGRRRREEVKIGLRTPLASLTVIHSDQNVLDNLRSLEDYLARELNVKSVRYDADEASYIELVTKPNFPVLGKRLGKRMKEFQAAIRNLSERDAQALLAGETVEVLGETFDAHEIQVTRAARGDGDVVTDAQISIALDCELTPALIEEGHAREVVNRVQQARKDKQFRVEDRIHLTVAGDDALLAAIDAHRDYIAGEVLALEIARGEPEVSTSAAIDGRELRFGLRVAR
ncbi:MAG: isoleucine--tRNA ligase [Pseudomonadota bacterium]